MAHPVRKRIISLTALAAMVALTGCQAVVGFDRDRIDGGLQGQDGGPDGGRDGGPDGGRDGGPDGGGPCDGVVCDEPPEPTCDGDVAVVASETGTCTVEGGETTCEYAETRTDCADTDQACEAGACVDPCEGVVCDDAPVPTCSDMTTRVTFAATGTCSSPGGEVTCNYAPTETDCAATDQFCDAGECVDENPCEGVTCDAPPGALCETGTAVTFAETGTCASPEGEPVCTYEPTETDCATMDLACDEGACVDPCPIECTTPPAALCEGTTAVTFAATGTCSSPGGVAMCSYTPTPTDCAASGQACSMGVCVDVDPCEGVMCNTPPVNTCEGLTAVTFAATGTCSEGTCTYAPTNTDCAAMDLACVDGACASPCPITCTTPPAALCEGSTAVTFAATGTCSSPSGVATCSYARTEQLCAVSGQACSMGMCVDIDPCDGVTCDTPGPAICEGSTAVTFTGPGTCSEGSCTYTRTEQVCTASQVCSMGMCLDVDPCDGVTCDTPGPAICEGSTAVTFTGPGTCSEGSCTYTRTEQVCTASQVCSMGMCLDVDPCDGVTCNTPPANTCEGFTAVTFPATGTCSEGSCSYPPMNVDCAAMNMACSGGACVDPCVGACTTAPAPECVGNSLRTSTLPATCTSPGGVPACVFDSTVEDCGASDEQCLMGACVDPCTIGGGVACDTPPADFCDGDDLVTYTGGSCVSPNGEVDCAYTEARTTCADGCSAGACIDLCDGVTCDTLPAAVCVDDGTERVVTASGVCDPADGLCDFATSDSACDADETCVEGSGCTDCRTAGCGSPRCAASDVCAFGYNFDFEDWSRSDPPFAYTKSAANLFSITQDTVNVNRGLSSAATGISVTGATTRDLFHTYSAPVAASVRYTAHLWTLDNEAGRVRVAWRRVGAAGTNSFGSASYSTNSPNWQEVTSNLTAAVSTPADALAEVVVRAYTEADASTGGTLYLDDIALTAQHPWTMDGTLEAGAFEVAAIESRYIRAGLNDDGTLYAAHPTASGQDRYLFVWVGGVHETDTVPAMWDKSGTVAAPAAGGALFVLAQEESGGGTFCSWSRYDSGMMEWVDVGVASSCWASNAAGLVEGQLPLTTVLGLTNARQVPRYVHVASVSYGTNDASGPDESTQLPPSTTANGNVDPGESLAINRAAILAGRLGLVR